VVVSADFVVGPTCGLDDSDDDDEEDEDVVALRLAFSMNIVSSSSMFKLALHPRRPTPM